MQLKILNLVLLAVQTSFTGAFLLRRTSPLRLWHRQVEVGARTLRLTEGRTFSVTCDGIQAGPTSDPHLTWYGPDRYMIAHEGRHNRISIERPHSPRFQKLHFRPIRVEDSGRYICAGWFDRLQGWQQRFVNLLVIGQDPTAPQSNTTTANEPTETARVTTTTTIQTTESPTTPPAIVQTPARLDNCTSPNFRCSSGECFAGRYRCDGFPDCTDRSDENNCDETLCPEGQFSCVDQSGCILSELTCNTEPDCPDGSDEATSLCLSS